jgi:hypothetical protein
MNFSMAVQIASNPARTAIGKISAWGQLRRILLPLTR